MSQRRSPIRLLLAAAAVVAVDAATKAVASAALADRPVRLAPGVALDLMHNRGVAFGLGAAAPPAMVAAVTGAAALLIAVLAWRGEFGTPVPAGLVLGGALANIADRATGGSVVDFVHVGRWPTFNLADLFLVTGLAVVAWRAARHPDPDPVPPHV